MSKKMVVSKTVKQSEWYERFLHATPSLLFRAAVGFILGYAFLSRAFDTGSYWQYFGALVFTILSVRLLKRSFTNSYGKVKTRKTK